MYIVSVAVVLVCQAVISLLAAAIAQSYPSISTDGNYLTGMMIFIQAGNALTIFVFCAKFKNRPDCEFIGGKSGAVNVILAGALALPLFVAVYLPTVWFGYFTSYVLHVPPEIGQIDVSSAAAKVMIVIASVFLAPVFEETIYRGALYNGLNKRFGFCGAALLCGLSFMLMHMSVLQVVLQFTLGAVSACIMHRTRALAPCIAFHAVSNALALIIELTPLGAALGGCVDYLTANIGAAFGVTAALLVAGGGCIALVLKFVIKPKKLDDNAPDSNPVNAVINSESELMKNKEGTVRYALGVCLCGIMFIINTVTVIFS